MRNRVCGKLHFVSESEQAQRTQDYRCFSYDTKKDKLQDTVIIFLACESLNILPLLVQLAQSRTSTVDCSITSKTNTTAYRQYPALSVSPKH